ncbi:MAG: two-component system response regulator HydG [Myxococcota bacterium]|jgi:two-component system response regulator HydG
MSQTLLIVDDERAIRFALRMVLEDAGYNIIEATDGLAALETLDDQVNIDLIISDLKMPRLDGMGLLDRLSSQPHAPPVIMITAHGSERTVVEAMKRGALDYFSKPFDAAEILRVVHRNLRVAEGERALRRLRAGHLLRRTMVFESEAMYRVAELVQRVAPRDIPVLITGESGTGKELVARAIVGASSRSEAPYIRFNCAALSVELAEAELFGHARGAFTGAAAARRGLFRSADGGSVLLDEVGELNPRTQGSLLRVLQEREVRPIGEEHSVPINVRLLAATNRNLRTDTDFRRDLYFRLNVVEIHLPPLRERPEDIIPLARHFARRAGDQFGMESVSLSPTLLRTLSQQAWSGNARELQHTMQRLVALSTGPEIGAEEMELAFGEADTVVASMGLKGQVDAFERAVVARMLTACNGNQSEAARQLQISRMTMVSKLKKYGLS